MHQREADLTWLSSSTASPACRRWYSRYAASLKKLHSSPGSAQGVCVMSRPPLVLVGCSALTRHFPYPNSYSTYTVQQQEWKVKRATAAQSVTSDRLATVPREHLT